MYICCHCPKRNCQNHSTEFCTSYLQRNLQCYYRYSGKPQPSVTKQSAPPLTPNTTVEQLTTNITRNGCGTVNLCASQPADCDPSAGSCFLLSARQISDQNFQFALSGESDGYIAATLSPDNTIGNNDTTYVCANNNTRIEFFGSLLDNGRLILVLAISTTVTNTLSNTTTANTTTASPTTNHAVSLKQFLSQALLISLGVVGLVLL
ncbi:hypothetical protein LDENG_00183750 [Lucifuga dentata]|nr:hypothetical protein LDENG_00183750 [Lucifuga dentata]